MSFWTDVLKNLRKKKRNVHWAIQGFNPFRFKTLNSAKFQKLFTDGLLSFTPTLSATCTSTYKLAKFLVPMLELLTTNQYTIKDSFTYAEQHQSFDSKLVMASFDIEYLFTNIPLQEKNWPLRWKSI